MTAAAALDDGIAATTRIATRRLGIVDYASTRDAMIAFTRDRDETTADEIWLLEHPPVYTLGQAGRTTHLHPARDDIPVVRTERGGQVTYHGPGQLVAYLLIDLKRRGIKVREFVRLIEASVVDVLATYNLHGRVEADAPGVYVDHDGCLQKIAALGLKISNGRSFHGVSCNVAMDLNPYDGIDACGFPGLRSIDLASLGATATVDAVGEALASALTTRIDAATRRD